MLRKATFFVFEASHINTLRVTSLAGNSYPYYQDKKKHRTNAFKNLLFVANKKINQ